MLHQVKLVAQISHEAIDRLERRLEFQTKRGKVMAAERMQPLVDQRRDWQRLQLLAAAVCSSEDMSADDSAWAAAFVKDVVAASWVEAAVDMLSAAEQVRDHMENASEHQRQERRCWLWDELDACRGLCDDLAGSEAAAVLLVAV